MANETEVEKPKYSSDSHGPDAPLFSDSLFDFLVDLRENTDTFDPQFYDKDWLRNTGRDVTRDGPITPAAILPDYQIRALVRHYTGETTDLEVLE